MNTAFLFIVSKVVNFLPDTNCFALKRSLYRLAGVSIGKNVRICSSVSILGNSNLIIGDNVWIGHQTIIVCSAPVTIGSNVNIAPRVYIGTGTHDIEPNGLSVAGKGRNLPISIGSGSWLCADSKILAGATIGERSIVAMGAVVLKNVQPHEVWGGVPARKLKSLKKQNDSVF